MSQIVATAAIMAAKHALKEELAVQGACVVMGTLFQVLVNVVDGPENVGECISQLCIMTTELVIATSGASLVPLVGWVVGQITCGMACEHKFAIAAACDFTEEDPSPPPSPPSPPPSPSPPTFNKWSTTNYALRTEGVLFSEFDLAVENGDSRRAIFAGTYDPRVGPPGVTCMPYGWSEKQGSVIELDSNSGERVTIKRVTNERMDPSTCDYDHLMGYKNLDEYSHRCDGCLKKAECATPTNFGSGRGLDDYLGVCYQEAEVTHLFRNDYVTCVHRPRPAARTAKGAEPVAARFCDRPCADTCVYPLCTQGHWHLLSL